MTGLESFPATHLVMQLSSANFSRTLLAAAAVAIALGQAGCGSKEPEPTPPPVAKPAPPPKVETRTLHELAATDDNAALLKQLQLGQAVDALNSLGQTALHVAAINDKAKNIDTLLTHKANLHAKTAKEQIDAFHLACAHGSVAAAKLLLAHDINTKSSAPNGWTALHSAAVNGQDAIVRLFHETGKDLSPMSPDGTPLDFARIHKKTSTEELLKSLGAKKGAVLSVHLAARHGDLDALKTWLSNRANAHFRERKHQATPLHWAAEADQLEAATLLLSKGAKTTSRTDGGWTALHSAAAKGSTNVVALLLKRRVPINAISQSGTPLDLAIGYKKEAAAGMIRDKGGREGWQVSIHMAAAKGNAIAVQNFLKRGANVDAVDSLHRSTPLHWAAGAGKVNTMEMLIDRGATIDARSESNATPLHQAVLRNRPKAVKLLLNNNANVNLKNKSGYTPLDYATANKRTEITQLLKSAGALSGKAL